MLANYYAPELDLQLVYAINPHFIFPSTLEEASSKDLAFQYELCFDLGLTPTLAWCNDLPRDYLEWDIDVAFDQDLIFNNELREALQALKVQLPNRLSKHKNQEWWRINGQSWVEQLRAVMIKHRSIGHDWQFTEQQQDLLRQYYDANEQLMKHLNSSSEVNFALKKLIERSLLLPYIRLPIQDYEDFILEFSRSPDTDENDDTSLSYECKKWELTPRECEVWLLHEHDHKAKDIAVNLNISISTVKKLLTNIYAKQYAFLEKEENSVKSESQVTVLDASEEAFITIDSRPLLGENGKIWQTPYDQCMTVSAFLDDTWYSCLSPYIPSMEYGVSWVLHDAETRKNLKDMGRRWAEENVLQNLDSRTLEDVGIVANMRLIAVSLIGKAKRPGQSRNNSKHFNNALFSADELSFLDKSPSEQRLVTAIDSLPEQRFLGEFNVNNKLVRIYQGDITNLCVDAIVSSDDTKLPMSGGVGWRIRSVGGEAIYQEAQKFVPLTLGGVAVTTAGRLRAKKIFHAVVIDWLQGNTPSRSVIFQAVHTCTEAAIQASFQSIAFPLLGTGTGGFPVKAAWDSVLAQVVTDLSDERQTIKEVVIALYDRQVTQEIGVTEFLNKVRQLGWRSLL